MPGTFSQLYIQVVFGTHNREKIIVDPWKIQLWKYMSGIITAKGQKAIIVNGVADHVHLFIGLRPSMALSELVRDVKNNSSKWVNEHNWLPGKFRWQEGFGAFSYNQDQVRRVYRYLENQEEHHRQKTFLEEYKSFLDEFEVEFDPKYL